jgi:hypothetical protein
MGLNQIEILYGGWAFKGHNRHCLFSPFLTLSGDRGVVLGGKGGA